MSGTRGDDHSFRHINTVIRFDRFDIAMKLYGQNLCILRFGTEALRTALHFHTQGKTVNAFVKAGEIINLDGFVHLSAGGHFLNDQRGKTGTDRVERGGVTGRPAADDDHVIQILHNDRSLLFSLGYPNSMNLSVTSSQKSGR